MNFCYHSEPDNPYGLTHSSSSGWPGSGIVA